MIILSFLSKTRIINHIGIRRCIRSLTAIEAVEPKFKQVSPEKKPEGKSGIVLGAYVGNTLELTPSAKKFDENCDGKLMTQLRLATGNKMIEERFFTFYNLNDYHTVVVVPLLKDFKNEQIEKYNQAREASRITAATGCRILRGSGIIDITVESFHDAEAAAEGSFLSTYKFDEYKKKRANEKLDIKVYNEEDESKWEDGQIKAKAQNIARKLQDTPANFMTPSIFAKTAKSILHDAGAKVKVHNKSWAEKKNMFSFLSVARGSKEEPKFLEIHYGDTSNKPNVLVGKGVTFDSGGISIKPSANMGDMKADMGGAATIVGTIHALGMLNIEVPIVGLIPLTENMPSGTATKPGDVFKAMNGKSICVDNTDAEGRLILADALCYSLEFDPKWVINIATLTGAMIVALGAGTASGVFSNSDCLYYLLEKSAAKSGDRVWRFPLWELYSKQIKAPHVDVNNLGTGKGGGSCTAAAFLREFVPTNIDWMHIDMCSVMGPGDTTPYLSGPYMPGRPTRTLIEFMIEQASSWLHVCKRSDLELSKCFNDLFVKIFPHLAIGIPEINVDPFEPLPLERVSVSKGTGPVTLAGSLNNMNVVGSSNATPTYSIVDLEKGIINFGLDLPRLDIKSKYDLQGKILVLPLIGNGDCDLKLKEVKTNVKTKIIFQKVDEREVLHFEKMKVSFKVNGMRVHFDNLFNGNKVLGLTMNNFVNQNALEVVAELEEPIGESLATIFLELINNIFSKIPTDLWLLSDEEYKKYQTQQKQEETIKKE